MTKKIKIKKAYIFAFAFVVLVVLLAISGTKSSKTDAKYFTELDSDAITARVAKWDIKGVTKRDGKSINLAAGFSKKLNEGDTGSWYFQISNYSEVYAAISKRSKIRFRLDNDGYTDTSVNEIKWDFLEDLSNNPIENPISFEVNIYNSSVENLLTYQLKSNPSEVISYDAYSQLTNKADYDEVINSNVANCELFKTSSSLTFKKAFEKDENGKTIYFYYADLSFENITDSQLDEILKLGLGDTREDVTMQIKWNIGQNVGGGSISNNTYKIYELTDNLLNATYKSYDLVKNNSIYISYDLVENANEYKYYYVSNSSSSVVKNGYGANVEYNGSYLNVSSYSNLVDYYNNYTSEPTFSLQSITFDYYDNKWNSKDATISALSSKKYSELTSDDIAKLESCSVYETHYFAYNYSTADLNNYANYMNYKNYKSFIENTKFITNDATRTFDVNKYKITNRVNATGNDYVVTSVSSLNAKQYLDTLKNNEPAFIFNATTVYYSDLTPTQKNLLNSYNDTTTRTGLNNLIDKYRYLEHYNYLTKSTMIEESFVIDGKTYYIVSTKLNLYEYNVYFHSNPIGEPLFTFTNALGKEITVRYKLLTTEQKNTIMGYTVSTNPTYSELTKMIEKLTLEQYEKFVLDNIKAMTNASYLEYGLKCRIEFELYVEQVD